MKLGNLLPRLDLEPVVNAIKVGDEEDKRKRKKKGKKVAMSPKKLKQSMKNLKPETLLKPSKSMTVIKSPTNSKFGPPPSSPNSKRGTQSPMKSSIKQGSSKVSATLTPSLFTKDLGGLPSLHTAYDVIAYFAKNGNTTPLKFVYLNKAETGTDWRPYDLNVVTAAEVQEEHYIFSSKGVMHFTSKRGQEHVKKEDREEKPTNIMTLARWTYEAAVFKMLRSFATFKNYLIWKMMKNWRTAVKYIRYCKIRRTVGKKLFILKKLFQNTILSVLKKAAIFQQTLLFNMSFKKTVTLDAFENLQETRLREVSEALDKMCQESFAEASDVSGHIKDELKSLRKRLAEPSEKKSMADERIEREGLMAAIAELIGDKTRILKFLKLIDRMLIESAFVHALDTFTRFVSLCQNQSPALRLGVLKISVSLGPNGARFYPSEAALTSRIDEVTDSMLKTLNNAPRLSLSANMKLPLSAGDLLFKDEKMQKLRAALRMTASKAYVAARTYGEGFEKYRNLYEFVSDFDTEEYGAENPSFAKLSADLDQLGKWDKDIQTMRLERNVAPLLLVGARSFKQTLVDKIAVPQKAIMGLILGEGRILGHEIIKEYKDICTKLTIKESISLNKQADFVAELKFAEDEEQKLEQKVELVQNIYRRLDKMEVKVPLDDRTQLDDVLEWGDKFRATTENGRIYVKEQASKYEDKLNENIAALEKQCGEITGTLNQSPYVDVMDEDPSIEFTTMIMESLDHVKQNMESLEAQVTQLSKIKSLFDNMEYICTPMDTLKMVYEGKRNTWDLCQKWRTQLHDWFYSDVTVIFNPEANKTGLDANGLEKVIDEYFGDANAIRRKSQDDPVINNLLTEIKVYRQKQTMMGQLGHPSLLPRHWESLFKILDEEYNESEEITLMKLGEAGVFEDGKLEMLDEVCAVAGKEYSLQKAMDKMEEEWAEQEFGLKAYKETGTYILASLEEIEGILDDQIVRSQAMRGSRFIKPFEARIIAWEKKLKLLEEILENWLKVQGTWLYLEPIFSSPDIRKQMPAEAKRFAVVDRVWR